MANNTVTVHTKKKKASLLTHNFSDLFLNDCEYNNYFNEEQKAIEQN